MKKPPETRRLLVERNEMTACQAGHQFCFVNIAITLPGFPRLWRRVHIVRYPALTREYKKTSAATCMRHRDARHETGVIGDAPARPSTALDDHASLVTLTAL